MADSDQGSARKTFSEPVLQMVATASDEQLAWIVGPDRRFYSREAIEAATRELELRRERGAERESTTSFNAAAFAFGPLWYFYHGMLGRGVLILAVLLGALFGLEPVAEAVGFPTALWVVVVLVSVGGYCSRFAERDLAESRLQARLTSRKPIPRPGTSRKPQTEQRYVRAAEVGCRMAADQAKALLETEGITARVRTSDSDTHPRAGGEAAASPASAEVLVREADLRRARGLLSALLASHQANPSALCGDDGPPRRLTTEEPEN